VTHAVETVRPRVFAAALRNGLTELEPAESRFARAEKRPYNSYALTLLSVKFLRDR
jgi:hypothetical protein